LQELYFNQKTKLNFFIPPKDFSEIEEHSDKLKDI